MYSSCFPEHEVADGLDFIAKHKFLLCAVNMHDTEIHLLVEYHV